MLDLTRDRNAPHPSHSVLDSGELARYLVCCDYDQIVAQPNNDAAERVPLAPTRSHAQACLAPTRNENTPTRSAICYTAKPCGAIINWRTPACVSTRHTSTKQPRSTDDEMFITQVQRQPATRADTSTNASDEHGGQHERPSSRHDRATW